MLLAVVVSKSVIMQYQYCIVVYKWIAIPYTHWSMRSYRVYNHGLVVLIIVTTLTSWMIRPSWIDQWLVVHNQISYILDSSSSSSSSYSNHIFVDVDFVVVCDDTKPFYSIRNECGIDPHSVRYMPNTNFYLRKRHEVRRSIVIPSVLINLGRPQ